MHKLYELKEKLMEELEDYAENGKFSKDDVEAIKYTASAIDHICNIVERSDEEYSGEMMGGSYRYPMNYRRGGSYARGRGRNARRDSMGRYTNNGSSYAEAEEMVEELRELMQDAPDQQIKMEFERLIQKLEQM